MNAHSARIFEVGPRDGLQNEDVILGVDQKLDMIQHLADAGASDIEVGSFVHPDWVPQMADTAEVARQLPPADDVRYWGLVPNPTGLKRALEVGITHIATVLSASETHNQKNLNSSRAESLADIRNVIETAAEHDCQIRSYISTAFGCPYEGKVDFDQVIDLADQLVDLGVDHVCLGDTIGAGTPRQVGRGCRRALDAFGPDRVALHLHDTQGLGLTNAYVAWQAGMRRFDSAVGGTGGCPYAPGAAGNLATDDLVHLFDTLEIRTGVDLQQTLATSGWLDDATDIDIASRLYQYRQSRSTDANAPQNLRL